MRTEAVVAGAAHVSEARPAGGFDAALARAAERVSAGQRPVGVPGPALRCGPTTALRAPPRVAAARSRALEVASPVAAAPIAPREVRGADPAAEPAPIAPAALDRIALVARVQREGASVEMALGPDLCVRVARSGGGLELSVDATAHVARWAEAELPRLVGALRDRGIRVAVARVHRAAGPAGAALTASRGSATTARSSPGGTVAKW